MPQSVAAATGVTRESGSYPGVISDAFGIQCSLVAPVRWEGVSALVFGALDQAEHRRRQRRGVGALRDYRAVEQSYEAALGLTGGQSQLALPGADGGRPAASALRPPLSVDVVVVRGKAAAATIRRASYFAPVGRRIAVLSTRPRGIDDLQLRATWLEVGLAILDRHGEVEIVVEPGDRHGDDQIYRWWFAEAVYEAHLDMVQGTIRHIAAIRGATAPADVEVEA